MPFRFAVMASWIAGGLSRTSQVDDQQVTTDNRMGNRFFEGMHFWRLPRRAPVDMNCSDYPLRLLVQHLRPRPYRLRLHRPDHESIARRCPWLLQQHGLPDRSTRAQVRGPLQTSAPTPSNTYDRAIPSFAPWPNTYQGSGELREVRESCGRCS